MIFLKQGVWCSYYYYFFTFPLQWAAVATKRAHVERRGRGDETDFELFRGIQS